jgi:hypothetical protein
MRLAQAASGCFHEASSSQSARSMFGPRSRSGSSAEKVVAVAPFGQVSRRLLGSYSGRFQGGLTASMPLSPSIIVSRTSAAVAPTIARRPYCPDSTSTRMSSVALRVLPKPRPASSSQTRQPHSGASCAGRALRRQSHFAQETLSPALRDAGLRHGNRHRQLPLRACWRTIRSAMATASASSRPVATAVSTRILICSVTSMRTGASRPR